MRIETDRRSWLGLAAASAVTLAARAPAAPLPTSVRRISGGGLDAAMAKLREAAEAELAAWGFPGMSIALVAPDGFAATLCLGHADLERARAVTPEQLFQIGSISKSFVCLALHRLAAGGRLGLDATIASILPDMPLPAAPITVRQLMNHVAGLPGNAPLFPRSDGDRLWTGSAPGTRFAYSNTGYLLLGLVLERVTGTSAPRALAEHALGPLGLSASVPVIESADRARYAIGYVPFAQDAAALPNAVLTPGAWMDMDNPAGSIASTPADMARYMRALIAIAGGDGGALFPAATARAFVAGGVPARDFGADATYANGLATISVDGHRCLHHTGGMLTFSSAMTIDAPGGAGCYASVNVGGFDYRPRRIAAYWTMLVRSARAGRPLPPPPPLRTSPPIEDPARLAGRYLAEGAPPFELRVSGGGLMLRSAEGEGRLLATGKDMFATDHPDFARAPFSREQDGRLWWGGRLYGKGAAPGLPKGPERLAALAGTYLNTDPWIGGVAVYARGERLSVAGSDAVPDGAGWRFTDAELANERVGFGPVVSGRCQRLTLSGADFPRFASLRPRG